MVVIASHGVSHERLVLEAAEARELAADLLRAVEEATDHAERFPVTIIDGNRNQFVFWVRPAKENPE